MHFSDHLSSLWNQTKQKEPDNHSIQVQLDWLHSFHDFFRLSVANDKGENAEQWFGNSLTPTIQAFADSFQTKPAIAASLWQKGLNAHLITGLIGLRLKFHRVPKLTTQDIRIKVDEKKGKLKAVYLASDLAFYGLASDPLADDLSCEVVDSHQELDKQLADLLRQIGIRLEPLFRKEKLPSQRFWGGMAYSVPLFLMKTTEKAPKLAYAEQIVDLANQWYRQLLPEMAEFLTIHGFNNEERAVLYIKRNTCCLKYKLKGKSKCSTCHLRDQEEVDQKFEKKWQKI